MLVEEVPGMIPDRTILGNSVLQICSGLGVMGSASERLEHIP